MKINLLGDILELNNENGKWAVIGDYNDIIFSGNLEQCRKFWKHSVYFLKLTRIDLTKKYAN